MQYSYNTDMEWGGGVRIIYVDTWDKDNGDFRPLERLSMYKFVIRSCMCKGFHPLSDILGEELHMEGEVPGTTNNLYYFQERLGNYMYQLSSPYVTYIQGSL